MTRKWTFRANGQTYVLVKRPEEREVHVLMKIFLAKLYGADYPHLKIEVPYPAETRYKPDLLSLDEQGEARFWGECGEVSSKKLGVLIKKYRRTHLCFVKWNIRPYPFEQMIDQAVRQLKHPRTAPIDFINFDESHRYQVDGRGEVLLDWKDVARRRWE